MATIPTYKKTQKIALACCRAAECGNLVNGKCTAHTKEECAIERYYYNLECQVCINELSQIFDVKYHY